MSLGYEFKDHEQDRVIDVGVHKNVRTCIACIAP